MAIETKNMGQVSSGLRSAYEKALTSIKRDNYEYAIEILKGVVKKEPGFDAARTQLREQETIKYGKMGFFGKALAGIKIIGTVAKGRSRLGKQPLEALGFAEDAVAIHPRSPSALNLLADAAMKLEYPIIAIEALETLRAVNPKDEANLRKLAEVYKSAHRGRDVLRIWQEISANRPDNLEVQTELRAAAALATMEDGGWESGGDFHDKLKDKDEADNIEQEDRIVRNLEDVSDMIERYEERINGGEQSIDIYRKTAELYYRAARFDDAINCYNLVIEKMGTLDPTIDKSVEKAYVAKLDAEIKALQDEGGDVDELLQQRAQYRLDRAEERVKNYPNDNELRFQLALVYWEFELIDKSIEQFQLAQRSPHRRQTAVVYLGRCFHAQGQNDMALEQFDRAIDEMLVMDKQRMEALYFRAIALEETGRDADALASFKEIYQADVNFKDVSTRIKTYYDKNKSS